LAIRRPLILAKVLCFVVAGHSKGVIAAIGSGVAVLHPEFLALDFPLIIARTSVFKAGTRFPLHMVKLSTFSVYILVAVQFRTILRIAVVAKARRKRRRVAAVAIVIVIVIVIVAAVSAFGIAIDAVTAGAIVRRILQFSAQGWLHDSLSQCLWSTKGQHPLSHICSERRPKSGQQQDLENLLHDHK